MDYDDIVAFRHLIRSGIMDKKLSLFERFVYPDKEDESKTLQKYTEIMLAILGQSIHCHTTLPSCLLTQLSAVAVMENLEKAHTAEAQQIKDELDKRIEDKGDLTVGDLACFFSADTIQARLMLMRLYIPRSHDEIKPSTAFADWSHGRDMEAMNRLERDNIRLRLELQVARLKLSEDEKAIRERVKVELTELLEDILPESAKKKIASQFQREVVQTKGIDDEGNLLTILHTFDVEDNENWEDILYLAKLQEHAALIEISYFSYF